MLNMGIMIEMNELKHFEVKVNLQQRLPFLSE